MWNLIFLFFTQLFLSELQKAGFKPDLMQRDESVKTQKQQQNNNNNELIKTHQAILSIIESKIDSTISKLNRMDRSQEHNQGRLEFAKVKKMQKLIKINLEFLIDFLFTFVVYLDSTKLITPSNDFINRLQLPKIG